jgi:hypothetical protein
LHTVKSFEHKEEMMQMNRYIPGTSEKGHLNVTLAPKIELLEHYVHTCQPLKHQIRVMTLIPK